MSEDTTNKNINMEFILLFLLSSAYSLMLPASEELNRDTNAKLNKLYLLTNNGINDESNFHEMSNEIYAKVIHDKAENVLKSESIKSSDYTISNPMSVNEVRTTNVSEVIDDNIKSEGISHKIIKQQFWKSSLFVCFITFIIVAVAIGLIFYLFFYKRKTLSQITNSNNGTRV